MSIYREIAFGLTDPFVGVLGLLGGFSLALLVFVGLVALVLPRRERPGGSHWFFAFAHLQLLFLLFSVIIMNTMNAYVSLGPMQHVYAADMFENSAVLLFNLAACVFLGWAIAKRHSVFPKFPRLSICCTLLILGEAFLLWSGLLVMVSVLDL